MGGIGLNYDDDGNLTNDGTFSYTYDAENRLIAATPRFPATGSKKLEAGYDYQGRRVQKRVYTYNAGTWTLERTKTFTYDGWNVIREQTTKDSTITTEYYVWGLDLSGTLQGAGGIGGLLLWKNDRGNFLYLYDANGNVGQLVNISTGAIAARYEYDPFGNVLVSDGSEAQNNPYRFSTKYFDAETGWSYYGGRYYSAKLGRWPTRDPIEEEGGVNLYGFVGNDPISWYDALGLKFIALGKVGISPIYPLGGDSHGAKGSSSLKIRNIQFEGTECGICWIKPGTGIVTVTFKYWGVPIGPQGTAGEAAMTYVPQALAIFIDAHEAHHMQVAEQIHDETILPMEKRIERYTGTSQPLISGMTKQECIDELRALIRFGETWSEFSARETAANNPGGTIDQEDGGMRNYGPQRVGDREYLYYWDIDRGPQ